MSPETIEIIREVFLPPLAVGIILLIALGGMSAWVDYQKRKDNDPWLN